jgi:gluconate 2-dehydrogenase gamma chain
MASVPLVQISSLAAAAPSDAPVFTPYQMSLIDAVVNRLIPSDELGPGAVGAGVPVYLARSFAGHLNGDREIFSKGLAAIDAVARARHNCAFVQLSPAQQDEFLTAMEKNEVSGFRPDSRTFFNRCVKINKRLWSRT